VARSHGRARQASCELTLLNLFDALLDRGSTIIAIEHNSRVIAHADHLVDLGPGAGNDGGTIVYQGPPAEIIHSPQSHTGAYFRTLISNDT
jgi:excinuclease UvrABC ATPase subunit